MSRDFWGGWVKARDTAINILQCTGHPSTMKNFPTRNVSGAEVEKACPKERRNDVMHTPDQAF